MATNETKRIPAITAEARIGTVPASDGTMQPDGLILQFATGQRLELRVADLSPSIIAQAIVHGLKQKLVDAAAISRNPETGRSATPEDKYNAVREVYDRLLSGSWNATRGDGTGSGGLLYRALCELYPTKTPEAIRTYHDGLTKEQQAALRANPKVAPIIERLRTPKAAASVDSDKLLSGLEG